MYNNIPKELKERKQWVLWVRMPRGKKDAKVPYQITGRPAKTSDSNTWCTFDEVVEALNNNKEKYSGIGFVFTENDEYCGIDLDDCIKDGIIEGWANEILNKLDSYAEYSPSGNGIHIIAKGKKPTDKCKKGTIEIYEKGRYFTITGNVLKGNEIKNIQKELNIICKETLLKETA